MVDHFHKDINKLKLTIRKDNYYYFLYSKLRLTLKENKHNSNHLFHQFFLKFYSH